MDRFIEEHLVKENALIQQYNDKIDKEKYTQLFS